MKKNTTFEQIINEWGEFPITKIHEAQKFLELLLGKTAGWVIVDFLDMGSWYRISSFDIDENYLTLNYRDFENSDLSKKPDENDVERMLFQASKYSATLKFDKIEYFNFEGTFFLLVKGFTIQKKEIEMSINSHSQLVEKTNSRSFSTEYVYRKNDLFYVNDFLNTPIYSLLLVPKSSFVTSGMSHKLLFLKNINSVKSIIVKTEIDFRGIVDSDPNSICEKANTLRRQMESILKIELCYRNIELKKDYSQQLLGDTWGALKNYHSDPIKQNVKKFIRLSNELSHDTGLVIKKESGLEILGIVKEYSSLFYQEIVEESKTPSHPIFSEEYIAF